MLVMGLLLSGLMIMVLAWYEQGARIAYIAWSVALVVVALLGLCDPTLSWLQGSQWALTPLRSWFLFLLGVVALAASIYTLGYRLHHPLWSAFWTPLFLVSMVGVLTAQNLWGFMTAWEIMALSSFFLVISHPERPGVVKAGYVYLVMSQVSAMLIVLGLLLMAYHVQSGEFAMWAIKAHELSAPEKNVIFGLLTAGFAIKSGVAPFHIWLPRAHPAAPAPVSSLMSGVMIKVAVFGIIQFAIMDLGPTNGAWPMVLFVIGALSSLLGVLYALMEREFKKFLAYSSMENMGIIFMALGIMAAGLDWHRPSLEVIGGVGALLHALNHALFKSQLFLIAGGVEQHTGRLTMDQLGGLIHTLPGIGLSFVMGAMAISGLPPFNGFVSEWLVLRGMLLMTLQSPVLVRVTALTLALILGLIAALAGMAFVKAVGVMFLGQARQPLPYTSLPRTMGAPVLVLGVISLLLGIFPGPVIAFIARRLLATRASSGALLVPVHVIVVASMLLLGIGIAAITSRVWDAPEVPRWGGGRQTTSAMQFSAASFTKAIRTTFAVIYRPHRHLARLGPYREDFPERIVYQGGTTPTWERYLYRPVSQAIWRIAQYSTRVQAGPVRLYLTYLLVTIGVLLLTLR